MANISKNAKVLRGGGYVNTHKGVDVVKVVLKTIVQDGSKMSVRRDGVIASKEGAAGNKPNLFMLDEHNNFESWESVEE